MVCFTTIKIKGILKSGFRESDIYRSVVTCQYFEIVFYLTVNFDVLLILGKLSFWVEIWDYLSLKLRNLKPFCFVIFLRRHWTQKVSLHQSCTYELWRHRKICHVTSVIIVNSECNLYFEMKVLNFFPQLDLLFSLQGIESLKKEEANWIRKSRWKSVQVTIVSQFVSETLFLKTKTISRR